MNNYSIRSSLTNIAKNFIWSLSGYELKKKPIFLFAHRRGGSTLLMEAIAAADKYRYSDQPLSITSNSFNYLKELPHPNYYKHLSFSDNGEEEKLRYFFDSIIKGEKIVSAQWNFLRKGFHLNYESSVLKILNANALIDWFVEQFPEAIFIYLTRNPINQSISCMRNNWKLECRGFFNDQDYISKYLNESQFRLIKQSLADESKIEAFVANWILDALPILQSKEKKNIMILKYEDLVMYDDVKSKFAGELQLDESVFIDFFKVPSKSTKNLSNKETLKKIKKESYNPEKIDSDVGEKERENIKRMLKEFKIELYAI
jgi:hypothetical protein